MEDKKARETCLTVPLNEAEKELIRAEAERMGLTMASYARLKIFADIDKRKEE